MKKTAGLAMKALIEAMSENVNDKGEILNFLKESGCFEKEVGCDDSFDTNLREVRKAYRMALTRQHRLQILTLVAKVPFWKLKKFNPPEKPKIDQTKDHDGDEEMMSENDMENDDYEDIDTDDDMNDTETGM